MRLGNPGGVSLTVDGKNPLPPGTDTPITLGLGLNGQVSITAHLSAAQRRPPRNLLRSRRGMLINLAGLRPDSPRPAGNGHNAQPVVHNGPFGTLQASTAITKIAVHIGGSRAQAADQPDHPV